MDFWRRLIRNKHVHTFIGKELYTHNILGFSLHGRISNLLQKRIKLIKTSGIFEWWSHFIDTHHFIGSNNMVSTSEPIKPAMKGNVSLIFILLLSCLGISAISFVFELRVELAQTLVIFWYVLKSSCIFFTVIREDIGKTLYKNYNINKQRLKGSLVETTRNAEIHCH